MITVENLYHSYSKDDVYAVKNVSFDIPKGEVFGFLGPSGAGKSTTQGILTGLLRLQKGNVQVAGYDVKQLKRKMFNQIGVSFEQSNVYTKMTARENLQFYAKLFDVATRQPDDLLKLVGLDGKGNIRAGEFSKGMKHRLTFARSLINNPELWFLDEPTTGLDPAIASTIKSIIREENDKGVTIFLTTHNMYIADELCDRVAFIVEGEIKLIDSPKNLKLKYGQDLVKVEYGENGRLQSQTFSTIDENDKKKLQELIAAKHIRTMHTKEATLEEIFIKVTGRGLV
jgi:fluoroquinolone transport system ATP-binding protein